MPLRFILAALLLLTASPVWAQRIGAPGGAGAGGSGTPAGTDGALQYNSAGAFGGIAAGATTDLLVGGGALTLPAWTTATGSGAPVRGTSPTLTTPVFSGAITGTYTLGGTPTIAAPTFTTSASLGTGYLSTTKTAAAAGVTANLLVKIDTTGNVVNAATSDVSILGIAVTTVTSTNPVEVATRGIIDCVADNTTVAGNLLIAGTSTAGRCRDSGQADATAVAITTQVMGKALTVATVGNLVSVQLYGPGHYGALAAGAGTITAGATNAIPKYTAATTLDDSLLSDDASTLTYTGTLGITAESFQTSATTTGVITMGGATSGTVTQTVNAIAGTPTVTWGTSTGTPAVTATSPLVITASTGDIACTTCVTATSTTTLTEKTYNAESSGNVLTISTKVWLPAAACDNATATSLWDLPTTNPAAAACITGTNTQKGVLDFDTTTDESAQITLMLPSDWVTAIDAKIVWLAAATSGAVGWCVQLISTADAETDDPAFPAQGAGNCVSDTVKGTTLQVNTATITGVTATGVAAGELLHVKISRDANGGAVTDDMTGDARLLGVELTLRRAI